jgi:ketosteroid isomerase-like protein
MATRDVVLGYFESVRAKEGWESFLADELQFTNFTDPVKRATGKRASLEGIRRFYGMVRAMEVERVIVDGDHACALTRYQLQPPIGPTFESHIAEVFEVSNGKIQSFGIYFDSAPYPQPPKAGNSNGS